jgi:hypothetical protein
MGIAGVVIAVSQIMQNDMCIEKLPNITLNQIIADTKYHNLLATFEIA